MIAHGTYARCDGCGYRQDIPDGDQNHPLSWLVMIDASGKRHFCSHACVVRAASGRLPRSGRSVPAGLSAVDIQVLEQVALGLQNKEIAAVLSLADSTVRNHVARAARSLNAQTRTEAVLVAYRLHVLNLNRLAERCAERLGFAA